MLNTVKLSNLYIFTRQFSAMINGRLHLTVALANLARELPRGRLRDVLESVTQDVRAGVDMADSMSEHPKVFGRLYVSVVRSGLNSGRLADALQQLSNYLEQKDTVSKKVRAALTYPLFVTGVFIMVFHMMTFVILPRFGQMFSTLGRELPAPTQLMMDLGDAYIENWPLLLIAAVGGIVMLVTWIASDSGRMLWDEWKLKIPLIGEVWRLSAFSRFCRTFGVQLRYGIPAVEALRTSADAASNTYVSESVHDVANRVEAGSSLAQAFRGEDIFGDVVVQMIATGEEAGTLDELLISASEYFDTILLQRLTGITTMLNPLLTAVVGVGIAGMMVAAFLPVFELSGNV
ncbi:type II secretion system F family protein [Minwuia sp.]|uniref:type II secretion system F family protein n=1 Tax=Minwuia sp. TaxID=2493630 RepID=UPI003A8C9F88